MVAFIKILLAETIYNIILTIIIYPIMQLTGYDIEGKAKDSDGVIHLINSGACCLDANGGAKDENGNIMPLLGFHLLLIQSHFLNLQ